MRSAWICTHNDVLAISPRVPRTGRAEAPYPCAELNDFRRRSCELPSLSRSTWMTCWLARGGAKRRAPQHRVLRGHGHMHRRPALPRDANSPAERYQPQFPMGTSVPWFVSRRTPRGAWPAASCIGADAVAVPRAARYRSVVPGGIQRDLQAHPGMRDPYRGRSEDLRDRQTQDERSSLFDVSEQRLFDNKVCHCACDGTSLEQQRNRLRRRFSGS